MLQLNQGRQMQKLTFQQTNTSYIVKVLLITFLSFVFAITFQLISPNKVNAATIAPDGTVCTLDEAVGAINAATNQNGCVATGAAYGTDDTIDIPAGTFSYSATANITDKSVTIQGAGMGQTIIDSGDANTGLHFTNNTGSPLSATVRDLSIRGISNTGMAIRSDNYAMTISRVEIYSVTASAALYGIDIIHSINGLSSTVQDVYIHDVDFVQGVPISIIAQQGITSSDNMIERATISNVVLQQFTFAILLGATVNGGTITGTVQNSSITNVDFINQGIYIVAYADGTVGAGSQAVELTALNNTVAVNRSVTAANVSGLTSVALATSGNSATATVNAQNNVLVSEYQGVGEIFSCGTAELDYGGTQSATFTSLGGNITDDASACNPYFTQTNDQTGVMNLGSTLGPLQDNGGVTQTMALLTGSPAIDNGITNALSVDQRGTARPQGSVFDSGAYEFVLAEAEVVTTDNSDSDAVNQLADTGQNVQLVTLFAGSLILLATVFIKRLVKKSTY